MNAYRVTYTIRAGDGTSEMLACTVLAESWTDAVRAALQHNTPYGVGAIPIKSIERLFGDVIRDSNPRPDSQW